MPRYKIETTAMVRRTYEVEAASADAAEDCLDEDGEKHLIAEEDVNEDIDDVRELAPSEDH